MENAVFNVDNANNPFHSHNQIMKKLGVSIDGEMKEILNVLDMNISEFSEIDVLRSRVFPLLLILTTCPGHVIEHNFFMIQ